MNASNAMENELSTFEIKSLLKNFSGAGNNVVLSGGEISTRSDLFKIVRYAASDCNLKIELLTNGTL